MLVDAGTTVEDVDAIVGKVEKSLHDAIAVAILDCNFPSNRRNLQEDELHVVTVLSLPEDERESTECLQEEVSEGTDCYSVLAPFTLYYLYDGSLQGLVTILESSIGDFMQSMDSATLDAIDPKLDGLVFRGFIVDYDDTDGADPLVGGDEEPNEARSDAGQEHRSCNYWGCCWCHDSRWTACGAAKKNAESFPSRACGG